MADLKSQETINKLLPELVAKTEHKVVAAWAADCAERVLPLFEKKFREDTRPRVAIETLRKWIAGELLKSKSRKAAFAAHTAARIARNEGFNTACFAARSAGHAASAAHVPEDALQSADYAIKAIHISNPATDEPFIKELNWQYTHLLELAAK